MAKLVSATYGDALFDVAISENRVDAFYEEAQAVLQAFEDNRELEGLLNHPKIVKEDKITTIEDIFSRFVSKEMTGFLVTIVDKDRSRDIPDIFEYFINRVKEYKKIGTAFVTTPMELSEAMKTKVKGRLLQTTGYREFEMKYAVDESLIGGMVIRIGDRVIDSSIKHRLDALSRELYSLDV